MALAQKVRDRAQRRAGHDGRGATLRSWLDTSRTRERDNRVSAERRRHGERATPIAAFRIRAMRGLVRGARVEHLHGRVRPDVEHDETRLGDVVDLDLRLVARSQAAALGSSVALEGFDVLQSRAISEPPRSGRSRRPSTTRRPIASQDRRGRAPRSCRRPRRDPLHRLTGTLRTASLPFSIVSQALSWPSIMATRTASARRSVGVEGGSADDGGGVAGVGEGVGLPARRRRPKS